MADPDHPVARFSQSLVGYDKRQVDAWITEQERMIGDLEKEAARLRNALGDTAVQPVPEYQRVGEEISSLLAEADRVATEMRERAAADADRWRADAEQDAAAVRSEAAADAEALRGDAWAAAQTMIDDTTAATSEELAEAQDRARAIRAEAEREAHRLTAGARREADEQIRVAKMEAERLVKDAEVERDGIIEAARRTADQAQERARALEVRRDELLKELESVRGTVQRLESEIDEKRQQLEPEPEPQADPTPAPEWGDGIRVIPPSETEEPAPSDDLGEPVDALAMVEEVRRIREPEPGGGHVRVVEPAPPTEESEPEPEPESEPEPEAEAAQESADEPEEAPAEASSDELSALFSALRGDEGEPQPEPEPEPTKEAQPDPEPEPAPVEALDHEPLFKARATALLPVVNGALRGVKRELADAQNRALEALRVEGEWTPSQSLLSEQFAERLEEVRTAAYAFGWTAGGGGGDPEGAPEDVSAFAGDLAGSLLRAVGKGADTAAKSTELSRTFRAWRNDAAERHLRAEATRAHAEGVAAAIRSTGGTPHLVVADRGCSHCRAAAGPLDGGVPPLHAECSCVVA
ncbi:MAG: DivIVA domain-containing protein [Acidimicrobiia bacterium]|nr:MAG: DivIVA domain-containing protein [Acidimicrobiia bacterium]